MMTLMDDLKSFIKHRVTTKSNDFESALGKNKNLTHYYSKIGKHSLLTSSSIIKFKATPV